MALLTVQDASDGASISLQAAESGGDQIPQGSRGAGWDLGVLLLVNNGDTASHTVTVGSHPQVSVAAGEMGVIPVYGVAFGTVRDISYDAVTSMTVAAVQAAGD